MNPYMVFRRAQHLHSPGRFPNASILSKTAGKWWTSLSTEFSDAWEDLTQVVKELHLLCFEQGQREEATTRMNALIDSLSTEASINRLMAAATPVQSEVSRGFLV